MTIDADAHIKIDPRKPGLPLTLDCTTCGFRGHTLGPGDAIVAIRSLPRRYRAALAQAGTDEDADILLSRRAGHDWWSALELAGHVRDVLHAKEKRLMRILREDEPTLAVEHEIPPSGVDTQGWEVIVATLQRNAEQLARTADGIRGQEWALTARREGEAVTALDFLREAVHEGVHHLRDVDRAISAARTITLP